ncbi:MaoC family dehydratase [Nocardia rhamnosiphila]|uniref:MaoC/PaaZ C-terminal domain-containing protein n=1 Tax=Nocardia rhamnosiphila TaxID=426716 RepID=A0ABV2X271_9NOCA
MVADPEIVIQKRCDPFDRIDFARYSMAVGDPNHVHVDGVVAAEAGLPDVIASGGLVTALMDECVREWVETKGGRIHSAQRRFRAPLFPHRGIHIEGRLVAEQSETPDEAVIDVEAATEDRELITTTTYVVRFGRDARSVSS